MFHVEGANRKGGGVALFVIHRFKTCGLELFSLIEPNYYQRVCPSI